MVEKGVKGFRIKPTLAGPDFFEKVDIILEIGANIVTNSYQKDQRGRGEYCKKEG
jgi:hypothetical protein